MTTQNIRRLVGAVQIIVLILGAFIPDRYSFSMAIPVLMVLSSSIFIVLSGKYFFLKYPVWGCWQLLVITYSAISCDMTWRAYNRLLPRDYHSENAALFIFGIFVASIAARRLWGRESERYKPTKDS